MASPHETLCALFPRLTKEVLDALLARARVVDVEPGVTLCAQGAIEETFYVIVRGSVDVYAQTEDQRFWVDALHAGGCFGEIALILDRPRSADVVTAEATTVIEIDRATFRDFVMTNPQVLIEITQLLVNRILHQQEIMRLEMARYRKRDAPPPKFFVSYSRRDSDFVKRLVTEVGRRGITTWLDVYNLEASQSWTREVGHALDTCGAMLLIMSPDALASKHVEDEWLYYLDMGKPVVPIMYRECPLPYRLHRLQRLDFTHVEDEHNAIDGLVAFLNSMA